MTNYKLPVLDDLMEDNNYVSKDRLITGAKITLDRLDYLLSKTHKEIGNQPLSVMINSIRLQAQIDYIKYFYGIK